MQTRCIYHQSFTIIQYFRSHKAFLMADTSVIPNRLEYNVYQAVKTKDETETHHKTANQLLLSY